jgi:Cdc6-like AAA superfamily ATPase
MGGDAMETMAEWYGLKDGHKDFFIENDVHARLLFARSELDDELQSILRKSFRTSNPPKFLLFGDWGVGKTHTMRHIEHVVSSTPGFDAHIVLIEMPDITAKSTFQVAHSALLDSLGLNRVKNWVLQFQTKNQSKAQEVIQHQTQSEDIARAFLTLIGYGDSARICWDWLRGVELSSSEARSVGLPSALSQSNQLVSVLRMLGRLSKDVDGKTLVLMLDEATKLESVTNGDAIAHWINSFKILSDKLTKEVGFIVSASFRDPDDMPEPLSNAQIRSRFGDKHYIQLRNFGSEEANVFVRALLVEWVDPAKRAALMAAHNADVQSENITDKTFPFTERALEQFIEYACRNGGITNPRDIQSTLDDILNRAIDDGRHILSKKYLDSVIAAG